MGAFLTFILVTAIVIYGLRLLLPIILRWWIEKKQREFASQFGGGQSYGGSSRASSRNSAREGEIKVQQTASKEKKVNSRVGDYVEFEEEVEIKE